jgi:serine/threonine-protein kinase
MTQSHWPQPPPAYAHVPAGTQLNGIFEIDSMIGVGGMGEIYKGHSVQTGDLVAIKMIRPELAENEAAFALFRKEASIMHNLQHEAIVRYYVFSVDPTLHRPYLAMEFVDGEPLSDVIARGPLSFDDVRSLQQRLASGLQVAHDLGIVHRDVSPDNVILPGGNVKRAKIIDFGIARAANLGGGTVIGGGFAGKHNYVSPEQLGLFGGDVTAKSDIYSLGLLLAEALAGRPIDMSGTQVDIIEKRRKVPDLGHVDQRMRPLIEHMLQPRPEDRPASMAEVAAWRSGATGLAPAAPRDARASARAKTTTAAALPPRERRSAMPFVAAGLVAVVAIAGGAALYNMDIWPRPEETLDVAPGLEPQPTAPSPSEQEPGPAPSATIEPEGPTLPTEQPAEPETPPPSEPQPSLTPPETGESGSPTGPGATIPSEQATPTAPAEPQTAPPGEAPSAQETPESGPPLTSPLESAPPTVTPAPQQGSPETPEPKEPTAKDEPEEPPASTQPDTPPAVPEPSEPAPGPGDRDEPSIQIGPPEPDRLAQVASYVRDYDGGACFLAVPTAIGGEGETIDADVEVFGDSVQAAKALNTDFREANGFEAQISVRQVTPAQCPVVDFLRQVDTDPETSPELSIGAYALAAGAPLTGTVEGYGNRELGLLLVSDTGLVYNLSEYATAQLSDVSGGSGKGVAFSMRIDSPDKGGATPHLLMALASPEPLDLPTAVMPAETYFPLVLAHASRTKQEISVATKYFKFGG